MRSATELNIMDALAARWPRRMGIRSAALYLGTTPYDFGKNEPGAMALGYKHAGRMWWDKNDLDEYLTRQKNENIEKAEEFHAKA